jgi:WD40 repeat protein
MKPSIFWDTDSGEFLHACLGKSGNIASVALHPTKPLLAGGANDGTVKSLGHYRPYNFADRAPRVVGVAFDPAAGILARGNTGGTVILWDTTNGVLPRLFERHRSPVCSVGVEPTARMLAIGSLEIPSGFGTCPIASCVAFSKDIADLSSR